MATPVDAKAFGKLKRIAPNLLAAQRTPDDRRARPLPEELCFKLTNRCDLRCSHCYHWGAAGYHHRLPAVELQQDLSLPVIAQVLEATRGLRSNVFLWGGEPLLYRDWDGLVELLAADVRWTTICTNGTLVERRLDSLLRMSAQLELSISVDGFPAENDALRGAGAFARTIAGIRALVRCRRSGNYRGELSVNCVIGDAMVEKLDDFLRFLEAEGVETVYLSLPWYISDETSREMHAYLTTYFPELARGELPSWRSFGFKVAPDRVDALARALARVEQANWRLKVRGNPKVTAGELPEFLSGSSTPMQHKTQCLALRTRLDVFPNADVVACKFFPEFTVGNLQRASLPEIWHGPAFARLRETLARNGVMPVCAKCNLLYARGR
jgi:MoaA/NifB/PqqE/SkfB family radical SAM enzyme